MIKAIVPVVLWFYFSGPKYDGSNKLNTIPGTGSGFDHKCCATNLVDFLEADVCIYYMYCEYQQKRFGRDWMVLLAEEESKKNVENSHISGLYFAQICRFSKWINISGVRFLHNEEIFFQTVCL